MREREREREDDEREKKTMRERVKLGGEICQMVNQRESKSKRECGNASGVHLR